eukprot:INCI230.1.p1 GENE.INCI230.1~~INCI230.1.p1  ORF type:complete len:2272 (-),score=342.75 INCI230.1:39-6854(-)
MARKVRLGLCRNTGANRGVEVATVVVAASFEAILKAAVNKLKIGKRAAKTARLFVARSTADGRVKGGTELLRTAKPADLERLLENGMLISVAASAESFVRKNGSRSAGDATASSSRRLPRPPRWGVLDTIDNRVCGSTAQSCSRDAAPRRNTFGESKASVMPRRVTVERSSAQQSTKCREHELYEMRGRFPVLVGNVLSRIRQAIAGSTCFVEKDLGTYRVFDYKNANAREAFPDPDEVRGRHRWERAVRRECRGLVVDSQSGAVLARRFHKFFNVDEVPETSGGAVAALLRDCCFSGDAYASGLAIAEKIDGSLASPVLLPGCTERTHAVRWLTRSTVCDELEQYVESLNPKIDVAGFAFQCLSTGWTPLFEWCSPKLVVGVVKHTEPKLVLLAVRRMSDGMYQLPREVDAGAARFGVPVARSMRELEQAVTSDCGPQQCVTALKERVAAFAAGNEGVVVRICRPVSMPDRDDFFCKIKSHWYVSVAAASLRGNGSATATLLSLLSARPSLDGVPQRLMWGVAMAATCGDTDATSLASVDDIIPACERLLAGASNSAARHESMPQAASLRHFLNAVNTAIQRLQCELLQWAVNVKEIAAASNEGHPLIAEASDLLVEAGFDSSLAALLLGSDACCFGESEASLNENLRKCMRSHYKLPTGSERVSALLGVQWDVKDLTVRLVEPDAQPLLESASQSAQFGVEGLHVDAPVRQDDQAFQPEIVETDIGMFESPPPRLQQHVLTSYLKRKIANFLGVSASAVVESTPVLVPADNRPDEGKLKGQWEMFRKAGIIDLRVDLQPSRSTRGGHDDHFGDPDWANWSVQFGPQADCARSTKPRRGETRKGTFACVLMRTGVPFQFRQLREAMQLSFSTRKCARLQVAGDTANSECIGRRRQISPPAVFAQKQQPKGPFKVFLDLDGTLADFAAGFGKIAGGRLPGEVSSAEKWKLIMQQNDFFEKLPWTSTGRVLWDFLESMRVASNLAGIPCISSISILTSVPSGKLGKHARKRKRAWVKHHLGPDIDVHVCTAADKRAWCTGPDCILVDDRPETHERGWCANGGSFVHFGASGAHGAIWRLRKCFDPTDYNKVELQAGAQLMQIVHANKCNTGSDTKAGVVWISGTRGVSALRDLALSVGVVGIMNSTQLPLESMPSHVVAVDVEWRPDEDHAHKQVGRRSAAAVLQLAAAGCCSLVIDLCNVCSEVQEMLNALFTASSVLKLFFGLEEDTLRLSPVLFQAASLAASRQGKKLDTHAAMISPVLDVQAALPQLIPIAASTSHHKLSLSSAARLVLGDRDTSLKSKVLQTSDWEARPLGFTQLQYAADDACILLEMYQAFVDSVYALDEPRSALLQQGLFSLVTSSNLPPSKVRQRYTWSLPQTAAAYGGVTGTTMVASNVSTYSKDSQVNAPKLTLVALMLTEESRARLVDLVSPRFSRTIADHVTLSFRPCPDDVPSLLAEVRPMVGKLVHLTVRSEFWGGGDNLPECQAVSVDVDDSKLSDLVSSGMPHITISVSNDTPPAMSLDTLTRGFFQPVNDGKGIELSAVLTLQVSHLDLPQTSSSESEVDASFGLLPANVRRSASLLAERAGAGECLKFKASELTGQERWVLHTWADAMGLEHRSEGNKKLGNRRFVLSVPKHGYTFRSAQERANDAAAAATTGRIVGSAADLDNPTTAWKHSSTSDEASSNALIRLGRQRVRIVKDAGVGAQALDLIAASTASIAANACAQEIPVGRIVRGSFNWIGARFRQSSAAMRLRVLMGLDPQAICRTGAGSAGTVIILRGLPGSGKSRFAELMRQRAAHALTHFTVCSADHFFERGAGLLNAKAQKRAGGPEAVYREVFDQALLPDAHDFCRAEFLRALREGSELANTHGFVVVVDNTHVEYKSYKWYLEQAALAGVCSIVVELLPPVASNVSQFTELLRRGKHGVSAKVLGLMRSRWEPDEAALKVQAFATESHSTIKPSTPAPGDSHERASTCEACVLSSEHASGTVSLKQWLTANRCFTKSKKQCTHLEMAVGVSAARMLHIPENLVEDFRRVLAAEQAFCAEGSEPQPQFLAELASQPVFPFFVDLDFGPSQCCSLAGEIQQLPTAHFVAALQTCIRLHFEQADGNVANNILKVAVTGYERVGDRRGLHLHCPCLFVEVLQARALRATFVATLAEAHGPAVNAIPSSVCTEGCQRNAASVSAHHVYQEVVDASVFQHMGLRMLWSRKTTKGRDVGRRYSFFGLWSGSSTIPDTMCGEDPHIFLKLTSVRVPARTAPTEGWHIRA